MKATTAPGYDDIPLSHAVGWLLAGVGYTAAYFIFMRSSYNFHKPCLPAFSLAINIAWEIALILISPVTPLASFVYVQWVVVDVALVHNQVKYGGLGLIEFLGSLVVGGLGEWCAMRTIIEVVVSAGATEEQARFQAAFWTGYGCQLVISSWSLVQVAKGQGAHLNYAGWAARVLGSVPVGLLTFDRARSFPDLYWYVNSPMGTFMILATMSMDGIWPVVRWYVKQDVDDMNKSAVSNRKDLKYH